MAEIITLPIPKRADAKFYKREHSHAHEDLMFWLKRNNADMVRQNQERRRIALHRMVEAYW